MKKILRFLRWFFRLPIQLKIFGLAIIFLIISVLLRYFTPQVTPESIIVPITSSFLDPIALDEITFSTDYPDLPDEFSLYQGATTNPSSRDFAAFIASNFGLPESKELKNLWVDSVSGISIDYREHNQQIVYLKNHPEEPLNTTPPSINSALPVAQSFIQDTLGINTLTPNPIESVFLGHEHGSSEAEAEVVRIPFIFSIQNFPTYFEGARDAYAFVYIDSDYRVVKAEFFAPPPQPTEYAKAATLSKRALEQSLKRGNGEIIGATTSTRVEIKDLSSLEIETITLEYRYNLGDNRFYPYMRIRGTGSTQGGEQIVITLIHPAVELSL